MNERHLVIVLAGCLVLSSAATAKLYRWVDDEGNVHYSDQVPPEHARKGRSELNERGMTVEETEAARDREEMIRERERQQREEAEQRRIEADKAAERELLASFQTVDDLILARNGKLAAVDFEINVKTNELNRLKARLADARTEERKRKEAAQGAEADPQQAARIDKLQRQIAAAYAEIIRERENKERITAKYEEYLKDYRTYKRLADDAGAERAALDVDESQTNKTMAVCEGKDECSAQWQRALNYVQNHKQTEVILEADDLLVTAPPSNSNELGLSLARMPRMNGEGSWIFLDMQCNQTLQGSLFCTTDEVAAIRDRFMPAVSGDDAPPAAQTAPEPAPPTPAPAE